MTNSTKNQFTVRNVLTEDELPEGHLRTELIAQYVDSKEKQKSSIFAGLTGSEMIVTRGLELYFVDDVPE